MNRLDFVSKLSAELDFLGVTQDEKNEILEDFGMYFEEGAAQGLTEEQICGKLGDYKEIAKQYAPASYDGFPESEQPVQQPQTAQIATMPFPQQSGQNTSRFNAGGLIGIICMDIFVFSWLIPSVGAIIISYYACVISFLFSGLTMMIGSVFAASIIYTSFTMFSVFFLGIAMTSLGVITALISVYIWRAFVVFLKWVVNLHSSWVVGTKIFKKKAGVAQ